MQIICTCIRLGTGTGAGIFADVAHWEEVWADHGSGADDDVSVWRSVRDTPLDYLANTACATGRHGAMHHAAFSLKNFQVYEAMGASSFGDIDYTFWLEFRLQKLKLKILYILYFKKI